MSTGDAQLEVLLACFEGHKRAGKVHGTLGKKLEASGAKILDQAVLSVTDKGKAKVYDPRRVLWGTVLPAITWGAFGLLASGGSWKSLVIWAVIGAVCGGLYAYYTEHVATKADLARLGKTLSPDSSAIFTFLVGPDAAKVAATAASFGPEPASVATISGDLSATVLNSKGAEPRRDTLLTMLMFRYPGKDTATRVYATASRKSSTPAIETELLMHADPNGKFRVASPSARAFVKSDVVGWGVLGLIVGVAVGIGGDGGLFGVLEKSVVTGIFWALFGVVAGTLYGLYAGRAVTAGRLKAFSPLLPPDTSASLAWAEGPVTRDSLAPWETAESQELAMRINQAPHGAVLEA